MEPIREARGLLSSAAPTKDDLQRAYQHLDRAHQEVRHLRDQYRAGRARLLEARLTTFLTHVIADKALLKNHVTGPWTPGAIRRLLFPSNRGLATVGSRLLPPITFALWLERVVFPIKDAQDLVGAHAEDADLEVAADRLSGVADLLGPETDRHRAHSGKRIEGEELAAPYNRVIGVLALLHEKAHGGLYTPKEIGAHLPSDSRMDSLGREL